MRAALLGVLGLVTPTAAMAARPFDKTDAAVAELHEVELEIGVAKLRPGGGGNVWTAPQIRYNYGLAPRWEVVGESEAEHAPGQASALVNSAVSLKTTLHEGSLQDKAGLSVATEASVLLPESRGPGRWGAELTLIAGRSWGWGSVNLDLAVAQTRDSNGEVSTGIIVKGPERWRVVPVAEVTYAKAGRGEEKGLLVGAIVPVREGLAFDVAVKQGSSGSGAETEVRAGLTVAFRP